jgi:hypothetical protein
MSELTYTYIELGDGWIICDRYFWTDSGSSSNTCEMEWGELVLLHEHEEGNIFTCKISIVDEIDECMACKMSIPKAYKLLMRLQEFE